MSHITTLPLIPSTNSYLKQHAAEYRHGDAVMALSQSAGRGQRGNSWEAEPGKNVTLSIMLRHRDLPATEHFYISEVVALAVAMTVEQIAPQITATVKWPNDIYVADSKIAGILIENSLSGRLIDSSVAGIGLNVNQLTFLSDAPNPVSIAQITGHNYPIDQVASLMADQITAIYDRYMTSPLTREELHKKWIDKLWRREGVHPYIDAATSERFMGQITTVEPSGHIVLSTPQGISRRYAFKEVIALLQR